jgi:hypothetical protein
LAELQHELKRVLAYLQVVAVTSLGVIQASHRAIRSHLPTNTAMRGDAIALPNESGYVCPDISPEKQGVAGARRDARAVA